MQVIVDDLLVSYDRFGKGEKTILLLHGWADPSATFKRLVGELEKEYSLITIDLAGFGSSQHPPMPWDVPDYAKHIGHFIAKLDVHTEAIIGHSNGGAIAINAVASTQIKTEKLVLLASSGIRNADNFKKKLYVMLAKPAKLILLPLPKSAQKKLKKSIYQKIGSDLYAAEHMGDTFKKIVNYDIQADAKKVSTDTLLIYGAQDRITPVSSGKVLSRIMKNSKLEVVLGAGHFLHQNKASEVAGMIRKFLK